MNGSWKEKLMKKKVGIALGIIILIGIFLRTYHFSDWLFFQADQARDFNMAVRAYNQGPGYLPLLGPKAGGTFLRLGPVFYYFQYLAVLLFGVSSPSIVAYPDLLLSILTLPLLFLFLREFFSKNWSLALTFSYAVCFFAVQYSRFAWNPNSLPFFNLLFFYALLKFFKTEEKGKKIWWMLAASVAYAIASQLHFVSLLSLPFATGLLILGQKYIAKKPIGSLVRYLPVVLLVVIIFYLPAILSDFQTSGNNAANFLDSFGKKSSDSGITKLFIKDSYNFSKYFLIILSGIINADSLIYGWFGVFIVLGLLAGFSIFRKETDNNKKMFLLSVLVWLLSYAAVYLPLGGKVQPRHFLPILPIPFILWGLVIFYLNEKSNWKPLAKLVSAIFLLSLPIALNAYSLKTWFQEIAASQTKITYPRKSGLLKSVGGESWWHLDQTISYMRNNCEKDRIFVVPPSKSYQDLMNCSSRLMGEKRPFSVNSAQVDYYDNSCYYYVYFSRNDFSDRFNENLKKINEKSFGDMSVIRFEMTSSTLRHGANKMDNPFRKKKDSKNDNSNDDADVDNTDAGDEPNVLDSSGGEDNSGQNNLDGLDNTLSEPLNNSQDSASIAPTDPARASRIFWKDLFN